MLRKRLTVLAASIAVFALSTSVFAQAKPAAKPTAKPAAKPAAKAPAKAPAPVKSPLDTLQSAGGDVVVATVNAQKITKKQLTDLLWGYQAANVLDKLLINNVIIAQKAKQAGVSVTEKEINAKVQEFEKTNLQGGSVNTTFAEMGLSKQIWIANSVVPQLLVEKIAAKQVGVTDAEIAEYIKARHILVRVKPGANEEEQKKNEEEAKAKIDKIVTEIKGGKDYVAAADEYSEDPGNINRETGKKNGGDLSWFKRGKMAKEFEEAAFALKPGEMSAPVKHWAGYSVIRLEKLGRDASSADKAEIKTKVAEEKKAVAMRQLWSDLRKDAKVDNKLVIKPKPAPKPPAPRVTAPPAPKPVTPPTAPKPATPATPAAPAAPAN
ncbi:MAG: peptidylprolyl isomerase [Armatimonadota bacterium]|nr:peptidylprolyl isomerase [Armatimonadota bacterium]